jgi:hypothetical protein
MYLVLFGVGLLVTAAGFVTIGFGIPINAFSLGNTLIISGTIAVVGGFLLLGIAAAIRHLNRIAVALGKGLVTRPIAAPAQAPAAMPVPPQVQAPVMAPAEPMADSLVPPTARLPQAPVRPAAPPRAPEPPRAEPRFPAASAEPSSGPLDWLRSKANSDAPPAAPEAPVMEVPDEAPLSPRTPQRTFSPSVSSSEQQPVEPKLWMPSRGEQTEAPAREPRAEFPPMTSPRSERVARAAPPVEPSRDPGRGGGAGGKDAGLFDVVWPDVRSKQAPSAEPAPPRAEMRPEVRSEVRPEPPARPREEPRAERPSAILKSGVIDGMGYTLYADGSIEAELPQGTVRFASVDALRAHLEKSS